MNPNLVLLRHGQSTWNLENRFTGWFDCDLSERGEEEARAGGVQLRDAGVEFDCVYTSVLKRAIRTMWFVLDELDQAWLPVTRAWELNERHYGGLQGLNKAETAAEHGEDQVLIWRRSFDIPPPPLAREDERHAQHDRRYAALDEAGKVPDSESLAITLERVLPYFEENIAPQLRAGKKVLIVAQVVRTVAPQLTNRLKLLHDELKPDTDFELFGGLQLAERSNATAPAAAAGAAATALLPAADGAAVVRPRGGGEVRLPTPQRFVFFGAT
mgnify:CR=1 FL=1